MPLFETKRIQLGDEWADVRELSVGQLKDADDKGTESAANLMRLLPERVVESALEKQRETAMERIIRYEGYDPETLIQHGIVAWSFEEPCDKENKSQLSARIGEILARAIFELSVIPSGEVVGSSGKSVEVESRPSLTVPTPSTSLEEPSPEPSLEASRADS